MMVGECMSGALDWQDRTIMGTGFTSSRESGVGRGWHFEVRHDLDDGHG